MPSGAPARIPAGVSCILSRVMGMGAELTRQVGGLSWVTKAIKTELWPCQFSGLWTQPHPKEH